MWRRAKVGLVDPFGARIFIFQTKHHECNEGESEEPTGKDSNESVYGRSGSSVVVLGLARAAPEQRRRSSPVQRHRGAASPELAGAETPRSLRTTSTRAARTNIIFADNYFVFFR